MISYVYLMHFIVLTIRAVASTTTSSGASSYFFSSARATPLLFKIDSTATSAASILTTFKRCTNR